MSKEMDKHYKFGLRQRPTFKQGYQYLIDDDDTIELPDRRPLAVEGSFERNQSKDFSVDRATEMQLRMQQAQYLATDNQMPYGPPPAPPPGVRVSDPGDAETVRMRQAYEALAAGMTAMNAAQTAYFAQQGDATEQFARMQAEPKHVGFGQELVRAENRQGGEGQRRRSR